MSPIVTVGALIRRGMGMVFVLLCLQLAGCSTMGPKLEAPRLSLVNVGMVSADIFSQQFRVRMHVQNPNDRAIPVKGIDYELFLQGDSFAEGVTSESFVVPALGESEFDMIVRTNFVSSIGRLLSRLSGSDANKVAYSITGKVMLDQSFVRNIPFHDEGTVDLSTLR
jgi:LEA14-like dessication related protein